MDQRRKVLITSITFSIGIFGVVWWSYVAPGTVPSSWQERLQGGPDTQSLPSKNNTRPVYLDRKATDAAKRARDKVESNTLGQLPEPSPTSKTLFDAESPKHVAVEITGTTSDQGTWNDPENQKVLGDKRWMAVESPEETARIKAILDRPMPIDSRATPLDRRTSIELLRPEVEFCVEAARKIVPGASGRFVVSYELSASEKTAVVQNTEVDPLVGFDGVVGLRDCIIQRIEGRTFEASRQGEPLLVEYPFFFE